MSPGGHPRLSPRSLELPRSGIREVMELAAGRPDVIHLEVGEPDFPTPPHIIDAAAAAARAGSTKYTAVQGTPALRAAIVGRLAESRDLRVPVEAVMATPGGGSALHLAYLGIVAPGEEVLIPDPGWPNTEAQVLLAGGMPVRYPLRGDRAFVPDLDTLAALFRRSAVRAIYVNSPANPTGAVFDAATVAAIVELARAHDCWIVSDECYEAIRFGKPHVSPLDLAPERTAAAFSCSKTYAMTGWRLGCLVGPPALVEVLAKTGEAVFACASSMSQAAAVAALTGPQDCVASMVASYRQRRDLVVPILRDAGLLVSEPEGAFYVLVDARSTATASRRLAVELLAECGVATAPGATFGRTTDGFIRISLAARADLVVEGVRRIADFILGRARRGEAAGASPAGHH